MNIRRAVIYVTGRDLLKKKVKDIPGVITFRGNPECIFKFSPCGDLFSLTINISAAPNILHRIMQRACFGMKYKML